MYLRTVFEKVPVPRYIIMKFQVEKILQALREKKKKYTLHSSAAVLESV